MALPETSTNPGSCWACGYSLRGLADDSRRCPDCGRPFDPGDPKSVNLRRPVGAIAKRALVPPGCPTVLVAVVAAALVVGGTGGTAGFHAQLDDWPMLYRSFTSRAPWHEYSSHWRAYAIGAGLSAGVLLWLAVRLAVRGALIARRRPPRDLRRGRGGVAALVAGSLAVSFIWVACGGALRIGREWAKLTLAKQPATTWFDPVNPPVVLSYEQRRSVLRTLALGGDTPADRRVAIAFHCADPNIDDPGPARPDAPGAEPGLLQLAVARESDAELAGVELRLLALRRDPSLLDFLARFLDDPRPPVRAAAAEAIGLVYHPAFPIGNGEGDLLQSGAVLPGRPAIALGSIRRRLANALAGRMQRDVKQPFYERFTPIAPQWRARLSRMMVQAPTVEEREAAARALLPQEPEGYRFRYAEWGVWTTSDAAGRLAAARAAVEEVPGFVHRAGNPIAEMNERILPAPTVIRKPVIHLTVSEPMAVDIEVRIRRGRPWFVYPMPDDFEVALGLRRVPIGSGSARGTAAASGALTPPPPLLTPLDPPPSFGSLPGASLHSGYPWTSPLHRPADLKIGARVDWNAMPNAFIVRELSEMGVHWQNLIVSPVKQPWMAEPPVGADPKHAWWRRLRDVDCSWVSSRGESERFLYYDGPTLMKSQYVPTFVGETLRFTPVPDNEMVGLTWINPGRGRTFRERRSGPEMGSWAMAVRVGAAGNVESAEVAPSYECRPFDRTDHPVADGPGAAEACLREGLLTWGLTASEAGGLLDAWRKDFFARPGSRLLTIMPQRAYESFCPLLIRPTPTELTRVGIIVTELP